jgi:hypothetical protein
MAIPQHLRTEENVKRVYAYVDKQIQENGAFGIRLDDENQMNELAGKLGLPQCDHGRELLATILSPYNPKATNVVLTKK